MAVVDRPTAGSTRAPRRWSSAFVIVLALALLLAAIAIVGSQPRLPSPFGRADNGLLAFERDGDIYTFDPVTGIERAIVVGRRSGPRSALVARRPDGSPSCADQAYGGHLVVVDRRRWTSRRFAMPSSTNLDTDTIAWSPGGDEVAFAAGVGRREVSTSSTRRMGRFGR